MMSVLPSSSGFLSYDYLQQCLGVSRVNLWTCPSCGPSVLPSTVAPSPHYSWGAVLVCGLCNGCWLVCKECHNVRVRFVTAAESRSHHRRKHHVEDKLVRTSHMELIGSHASQSAVSTLAYFVEQVSNLSMPLSVCEEDDGRGETMSHVSGGGSNNGTIMVSQSRTKEDCSSVCMDSQYCHIGVTNPVNHQDSVTACAVSSNEVIPTSLTSGFCFGEHNSHKFRLIPIPIHVLESIFGVVSTIPLMQYEVICSALKQIRFYKSFNCLFPDGKCLWSELLAILKKDFFQHHRHLDVNEINATVLVTDGPMVKPQLPHMDYCWETILLPSRHDSKLNRSKRLRGSCQIPFTGHLPVSTDGAYIYLWSGPGVATPFHIPYGQMLVIRGDVVHCGGLPPSAATEKLYHRVHFYFPVIAADIPPNAIYSNNFDGQSFSRDYVLP